MAYEEVGIRLRTDGVVESTTGVNLMEAALQGLGRQAGQVSPALGGVGQAAATAAGAMSPLGVAIGSVVAGAGLLTLAWHKGSLEAQGYQQAMILTGNAAGETAGNLQAVAGRIDAIVGTQAQAAEILAKLVSTGNVSRAQLEQGTQAAIELQRTFGIEADKTVAALSAIGRDPVRAVEKLNEQYRFLTISTWEQIRALAEQGRTAEAAAVAQDAYTSTALQRTQEMEKNLGTLQTAWRSVKEMAAETWDAMLGIGRESTLQEQLKNVEIALAAPVRRGVNPLQADERREAMRARAADLRARIAELADAAKMEAQIAANVQRQIEEDTAKKTKVKTVTERQRRGPYDFVGPPTFDEQFPAANVAAILRGRDANTAARAAELASYDDTNKAELAMRREHEAKVRAQAKETAEYMEELERQRILGLKPIWQQMVEEWEDTNELMRRTSNDTMLYTLQAGEDAWIRWAVTGKLSIRSVFETFVAEQARSGFRQLASIGMKWLLGGLGDGIDHGDGSAFPGRAGGGDVQAGQAYMVGEKGPELLFMGRQSGSIMSNDKLAGSGGGRQVVFAPVFNVDARTDKAEILQIGMQAAQADLLEKMDRREI
jgi:phage-related minor tail protein